MPTVTLELPAEVARALDQQARSLLLSRNTYIRAVLAAVVERATRDSLERSNPHPHERLEQEAAP
jgi:predicted transcriptional regulator